MGALQHATLSNPPPHLHYPHRYLREALRLDAKKALNRWCSDTGAADVHVLFQHIMQEWVMALGKIKEDKDDVSAENPLTLRVARAWSAAMVPVLLQLTPSSTVAFGKRETSGGDAGAVAGDAARCNRIAFDDVTFVTDEEKTTLFGTLMDMDKKPLITEKAVTRRFATLLLLAMYVTCGELPVRLSVAWFTTCVVCN